MQRNRINMLLLLSFVFIFQLKAQEIIDTANMRITYRVCQKALKNNESIVITDTMVLDIGHNWSKYYDLYRNHKDSIVVYLRLNNNSKGWSRFSNDEEALRSRLESLQEPTDVIDNRGSGESAVVYKNKKKNEIMTIDEGQLEMPDTYTLFRFTEYILPQQWKIEKDTLTVLQYPCQKASTSFRGRNYTAWFTIDIPINEGPWKFYGLPGLITKIQDTKKHYSFELIGFQRIEENIDTQIPKTTQKTTRKEFIKSKMGATEARITESEMARVGLSSDNRQKINQYDYIERDYK